jgi:hypothetical protein
LKWVCDDNETSSGWKLKPAHTNCSSLFGQIENKEEDSQINWENRCKNLIGDPNYINQFTCSINPNGAAVMSVKQLCPITVPSSFKLTDKDKCNGLGPVCTGATGPNAVNGWEKKLSTSSCDSLYGLISGTPSDTVNNWTEKCKPLLSDPNYFSNFGCGIDQNNNAFVKVTKLCSLTPPPDAPNCPYGSFSYCDASTGHKWGCKKQQMGPQCVDPPKGQSVCLRPDGKPSSSAFGLNCVRCGTYKDPVDNVRKTHYEMVCQNSFASITCTTTMHNVKKNIDLEPKINIPNVDDNDNNIELWLNKNNDPVYPTIDNDLCVQGKYPSDRLLNGQTNNEDYELYNNPDGFISSYEDGKTRKFYPSSSNPSAPKRFTYSQGTSSGTTEVCFYTPKDIVTDLGDTGLKVCSNRGKFNQKQGANQAKGATGIKGGSCSCSTYSYINGLGQTVTNRQFLGKNCQYSDIEQCSRNGQVNENGSCTCLAGFAGPKCQFSRKYDCYDKGNPANQATLSCTCDSGSNRDASTNCEKCNYYTYELPKSISQHNMTPSLAFKDAILTDKPGTDLVIVKKRAMGPNCQFNDLQCKNDRDEVRGYVNNDGVCTPFLYYSTYQQKATPFLGDRRQYDDSKCNNLGAVTANGTCLCKNNNYDPATFCDKCKPGFTGLNCETHVSTKCKNGGTLKNDTLRREYIGCNCGEQSRFKGAECDECKNPMLDINRGCTECLGSDRLDPNANPACSKCKNTTYRAAESCTVCAKGPNYETTNCTDCKSGYGGENCNYTNASCGEGELVDNNPRDKREDNMCKCGKWENQTTPITKTERKCSNVTKSCNLADKMFGRHGCGSCSQIRVGKGFTRRCISTYQINECNNVTTTIGQDTKRVWVSSLKKPSSRCTDCQPGYAGPKCEYSDSGTCSGHGKAQHDGKCVCANGWDGPKCQYSVTAWCQNNGVWRGLKTDQTPHNCLCPAGTAGRRCEFTDQGACGSDRSGTLRKGNACGDCGGCNCFGRNCNNHWRNWRKFAGNDGRCYWEWTSNTYHSGAGGKCGEGDQGDPSGPHASQNPAI